MDVLTPKTLGSFVSGKEPTLVLFHADWCPFCRKFKPVFYSYVGKTKAKMAEAKLNEEENPLWDQFHIEVIPTVMLFMGGKVIARKDGRAGIGLDESDLKQILKGV